MIRIKKLRNVVRGVIIAGAMAAAIGTTAYAGYGYTGYNTTVGRFNGNGYSGYQTKVTSGANGKINSTSVGGKYKVDVRMNSNKGNGGWARQIGGGESREIPGYYNQKKGTGVRLQFSNNWNTPVNVQVTGSWMSR